MNKKSILIAGGLGVALVGWMASGYLARDSHGAEPEQAAAPEAGEQRLMKVEVQALQAAPVARNLTNQGQVEPSRTVEVKAETAAQVVEVLAERGAAVRQGQAIVRLAMNDREAKLAKIEALVDQRERDYEALRKLGLEGHQSQSQIRAAYTALQEARADLAAVKLDIARTTIKAPFDGVLNARPVELGDYVTPGQPVATVVDVHPLRVAIDVPQQHVSQLRTGQEVAVKLVGGRELSGRISYIAAAADASTRTFRVEAQIANAAGDIPAGMSAEVRLPVETVQAHQVSPAVLSLADDGQVGVKTVGTDNRVEFHPVNVVRAEPAGVWVSGLPEQARVITMGQAYVRAGETVQPVAAGERVARAAPEGEAR